MDKMEKLFEELSLNLADNMEINVDENFGCQMVRLRLRMKELSELMDSDWLIESYDSPKLKKIARIISNFIKKIDEVL